MFEGVEVGKGQNLGCFGSSGWSGEWSSISARRDGRAADGSTAIDRSEISIASRWNQPTLRQNLPDPSVAPFRPRRWAGCPVLGEVRVQIALQVRP